jgi:archaemetzincin
MLSHKRFNPMKCAYGLPVILLLHSCVSGPSNSEFPREKKDSTVTAILPLGSIESGQIRLLSAELSAFYGMKIRILPPSKMPESCRLKNTQRYSAPLMLKWLKDRKPAGCNRILGVSTRDIFTQKGPHPHWGIFGLGYKPGEACIVSDHRLKQFGNKRDTFLTLVTLHEVGHNMGLPHCKKHPSCLMNDAKGTARTLFSEKKWLCSNCRLLLTKP